jgi:poly(hydroxyalkanoate) granule-associated protein
MAVSKKKSTDRQRVGTRRSRKSAAPANLAETVQQIWLAGMGAIARAQREGPSAFTDAIREGIELLSQSRSQAEQAIRNALETAQDTVQARIGAARDQVTETWDNIEALFQKRVQNALNQLGVPSAEEVRILTRRVEELTATVQALSAQQARARRLAGRRAGTAAAKRGAAKAPRARRAPAEPAEPAG